MIKRRSNIKNVKSNLVHAVFEIEGLDILGCGAPILNKDNYIPVDEEVTCLLCFDSMEKLGRNTIKTKIKNQTADKEVVIKRKIK
jgi:hypothetical protein